MDCLKCGHWIPNNKLACPICAERSSRVALREYQRHPLRLVAQGHGTFTTRVIASTRHVQMFGIGSERTFCGETIESGHRRGAQSFDSLQDSETFLCSKCYAEIKAILKEALPCSA